MHKINSIFFIFLFTFFTDIFSDIIHILKYSQGNLTIYKKLTFKNGFLLSDIQAQYEKNINRYYVFKDGSECLENANEIYSVLFYEYEFNLRHKESLKMVNNTFYPTNWFVKSYDNL